MIEKIALMQVSYSVSTDDSFKGTEKEFNKAMKS